MTLENTASIGSALSPVLADADVERLLETDACVLSNEQIEILRSVLAHRTFTVCFGGGVDSTAMLVALRVAGLTPGVLHFANVGAEKPETLAHNLRMNEVLKSWGWPELTEVRHQTNPDTGYSDLEGNCLKNETLPSLAFGMKSCSIKWKMGPQDQLLMGAKSGPNARPPHPLLVETQARGERIVKLIGYDRGKADLRRSKNLKEQDENVDYTYPLQLIGWARKDCVRAITQMLGPDLVPIKSACFFLCFQKLSRLIVSLCFAPHNHDQRSETFRAPIRQLRCAPSFDQSAFQSLTLYGACSYGA